MTLEYSVTDVLKKLLKKWWLIVAVAIIFGLASYPFAQMSYNKAYENYSQNTNFDYLLEKAEMNLKTIENSAKEIVEVEKIELSAMGLNKGTIFLSVNIQDAATSSMSKEEENEVRNDALESSVAYILSTDILVPLFNTISNSYTSGDFNVFTSSISATHYKNTDIISIGINTVTKEVFEGISNNIIDIFAEKYNQLFRKNYDFEIVKSVYGEVANEINESYIEQQTAMQMATEKLAYNKIILKEPTVKETTVKMVGTASVGGVIVGCFIALAWDYLRNSFLLSKEFDKELKNEE